eukprot:6248213-Pyramimonas_sp.AAC.1
MPSSTCPVPENLPAADTCVTGGEHVAQGAQRVAGPHMCHQALTGGELPLTSLELATMTCFEFGKCLRLMITATPIFHLNVQTSGGDRHSEEATPHH